MGLGRQLTNSATSVLWFIYLLERLWVGKSLMWVKVSQSQCSRTPQRRQMPHALYLSGASLLSLSAMRKAFVPLFCVELLGGNASFS